jgi:hypothetical protein
MQRVAERGVDANAFARFWQQIGDVGFIQDQVRIDAGRFGRHQRARHQVVGKAGFGGHDDEQARQVRCQQLRLVLVRAVQQRVAFGNRLDDRLVFGGHFQVDLVAHGHIGFLAARDTLQLASLNVGQVVAPVGGDDGASEDGGHAPARAA